VSGPPPPQPAKFEEIDKIINSRPLVNFENEFFSFDGRNHEVTFGDPGLRTTAEFKQRFGNGNDVALLFKKYWFIKDMTYVPISKKEEDGAQ
jgi:hypothetical protein